MAASAISICNRALLSVGTRAQITSINPSDGSTEGDACSVLFTPTFEQLARTARWNCLRKQLTLTLLAAAMGTPENPQGTTLPLPPTPWNYSYGLPPDCLAMRSIVPSLPSGSGSTPPQTSVNNAAQSCIPNGGQIPFAVAYSTDAQNNPIEVILTNQSQAQAIYTVNQPNPAIWDSLLQAGMVASLAAYLVPALSLSASLMTVSIKTAETMIGQARVADGNEGVTTLDHVPDWIRARGGATGSYNWGFNVTPTGAYNNMCWPGGY